MDDAVRYCLMTCPITFGGAFVLVVAFAYWTGHLIGYRRMERTYMEIMEAELRAVEAELNAAGGCDGREDDYCPEERG